MMLVLLTARYIMLRNASRVKVLILNLFIFFSEDAKSFAHLAESKPLSNPYSPQKVSVSEA